MLGESLELGTLGVRSVLVRRNDAATYGEAITVISIPSDAGPDQPVLPQHNACLNVSTAATAISARVGRTPNATIADLDPIHTYLGQADGVHRVMTKPGVFVRVAKNDYNKPYVQLDNYVPTGGWGNYRISKARTANRTVSRSDKRTLRTAPNSCSYSAPCITGTGSFYYTYNVWAAGMNEALGYTAFKDYHSGAKFLMAILNTGALVYSTIYTYGYQTDSCDPGAALGEFISQAMLRIAEADASVGGVSIITCEESKTLSGCPEIVEGMQFDRGYLAPYYSTPSFTTNLWLASSGESGACL